MASSSDICRWINELKNADTRESALQELSRMTDAEEDMAQQLWNSHGSRAALMFEITNIYRIISQPGLSDHQSNRVCNVLSLLQCVARDSETRSEFLGGPYLLYIYPFLETQDPAPPYYNLRRSSLQVIQVIADEVEGVNFLINEVLYVTKKEKKSWTPGEEEGETTRDCNFIFHLLKIKTNDHDTAMLVASIMQKILQVDYGLEYMCKSPRRMFITLNNLGKMVIQLSEDKEPSQRLLKHVIRCYLRLSDNNIACEALRMSPPSQLKDGTFAVCLKDDASTMNSLAQLLQKIS